MNKILVIGGNGSGKTTFSLALGNKLNVPVIHLDQLGWHGNWEMTTREEFDALLEVELSKEQWIIDGNYNRTIPKRLLYCDTVFYFDFSTLSCLYGVVSRIIKNFGKSRFDMGGYCPDKFDWNFLKNVILFNKNNRKQTYNLLNDNNHLEVVVFKNRSQVKRYLRNL